MENVQQYKIQLDCYYFPVAFIKRSGALSYNTSKRLLFTTNFLNVTIATKMLANHNSIYALKILNF